MTDLIANIRRRFASLLSEAEAALQRREEQYPALVAAGKLDGAAADGEIRIWRAITQDWQAIVNGGPAGPRMRESLWEKIDVLSESIRRFDRALAKAIKSAPEVVRRDCTEGQALWLLESKHGAAAEPILDVHQQRQRVEELRDWYGLERSCKGHLFSGIEDYLEFHRQLREANQQGGAAA